MWRRDSARSALLKTRSPRQPERLTRGFEGDGYIGAPNWPAMAVCALLRYDASSRGSILGRRSRFTALQLNDYIRKRRDCDRPVRKQIVEINELFDRFCRPARRGAGGHRRGRGRGTGGWRRPTPRLTTPRWPRRSTTCRAAWPTPAGATTQNGLGPRP